MQTEQASSPATNTYEQFRMDALSILMRLCDQQNLVIFFVVVRRYAIVVGVRTPDVIIVAIRGTKYLYDWFVNLRASKQLIEERFIHNNYGSAAFHKGFFKAILSCFGPVSQEIRKFKNYYKLPIYVTGHSLGGAMAAIMHTVWSRNDRRVPAIPCNILYAINTDASYTFGMPRYGDIRAVTQYAPPYHLYNDLDIVPTVPPQWLGFENCLNEFKLDGNSLEIAHIRDSMNFLSWIKRLLAGQGISNHAVEIYRERIRVAISSIKP